MPSNTKENITIGKDYSRLSSFLQVPERFEATFKNKHVRNVYDFSRIAPAGEVQITQITKVHPPTIPSHSGFGLDLPTVITGLEPVEHLYLGFSASISATPGSGNSFVEVTNIPGLSGGLFVYQYGNYLQPVQILINRSQRLFINYPYTATFSVNSSIGDTVVFSYMRIQRRLSAGPFER